jgi:hypothetical protein
MDIPRNRFTPRRAVLTSTVAVIVFAAAQPLRAQAPKVPAWAQPGSATHVQVPPPADYRRPSTSFDAPIGVFEGQTDVGSAVVAGSASFDTEKGQYTINSAGYNIWYTRDEFRYLWRKMSGDVSLAADIAFPIPGGYGDRKVVLIIRQDLDDDSKEAMVALHGAGLIHLAQRPAKGANIKEDFRIEAGTLPGSTGTQSGAVNAKRIGIEKRGDSFSLFVSLDGEPVHQVGPPLSLRLDAPFYVGIGFCSHLPDKSDTAILSDVVLENAAGKVR